MRLLFGFSLALTMLAGVPAYAQVASYGPSTLVVQNNAPNYWAGYPVPAQYAAYGPPAAPANAGPSIVAPTTAAPVPMYTAPVSAAPVSAGPMMDESAHCDSCLETGCSCCDRWFGSIAGLYLGRDHANAFWTSYETNNNAHQVLNTEDASANWNGGAEISFGHWFNCGMLASSCCDTRNGVELVYFFVDPMNGFANVRGDSLASGTVSTTIDLQDPGTGSGNVEIGGVDSATYFDNATEHRIWRKDEVQNIELNFLRQRTNNDDALQMTWLAGLRFFRFNEGVIFGSVGNGAEFGQNGGADEAYLNIHCSNDLLGPQVGVRMDYQWTKKLGLYATPKMGIYANQVSTRAHLYSGNGLEGYDIYGDSTDFSFMAQFDVGVNYQMTDHWRAFLGYRLIAATGITLSDNQFPHYLAATDELAVPDTNGDLILTGAMAGLEFTY